jgi:hypothetical protein
VDDGDGAGTEAEHGDQRQQDQGRLPVAAWQGAAAVS